MTDWHQLCERIKKREKLKKSLVKVQARVFHAQRKVVGSRRRDFSACTPRRHVGGLRPLPLVVRRRRAQLRLGLVRGLPTLRRRSKSAAISAAAADRAARRAIHNHHSTHDDRGVRRLRLHQRVPRQAEVGGRRLLR